MAVEWMLFLFSILIPVIQVALGAVFRKHAPKKINYLAGYRTERSMRSQEAWDYANRRMGEIWLRVGVCALAATAAAYWLLPASKEVVCIVLVIAQAAAVIIPVLPVEAELKKKFGD